MCLLPGWLGKRKEVWMGRPLPGIWALEFLYMLPCPIISQLELQKRGQGTVTHEKNAYFVVVRVSLLNYALGG
jgi:hypothetical protein